jgi:tetratricopeptide (TPR) repeat protein
MGIVYSERGDLDNAKACLEKSIQINSEIGTAEGVAHPLMVLGFCVHRPRGDLHAAVGTCEEALRLIRVAGNRPQEAVALAWLGSSLWALGDYEQAEATANEGLLVNREIENPYPESVALRYLGLIRFSLGDCDRAHTLLGESVSVHERAGRRPVEIALSLAAMALLAHRQGDDAKARTDAIRAVQIGQETGNVELQAHASLALGHALAALSDLPAATDAYLQAHDIYRQATWRNAPMEAMAGLARVALAQEDPERASGHVEEILEHLETGSLDGTFEPLRIYLTCVRVLEANADDRAGEVLRTARMLLQEQADRIQDEQDRQSFLENVPAHRELTGSSE